jgi:hypothetical protein
MGRAGIKRRKPKRPLPRASSAGGDPSGLEGTAVGRYYGLSFVRNLPLWLRHRGRRTSWLAPPLAGYLVLGGTVVLLVGAGWGLGWLIGRLF